VCPERGEKTFSIAMKPMIPTKQDISPTDGLDLDEREAVAHFFGKNVDDAETLLRENVDYYSNDLMWMGPVAFRFYFPALCNYLRSEDARGSFNGLYSLIALVKSRLEFDPASLGAVKECLLSCLRYSVDNYEKFEVSAEVYGDLRSEVLRLITLCEQLCVA
jgi:hypothetical protein